MLKIGMFKKNKILVTAKKHILLLLLIGLSVIFIITLTASASNWNARLSLAFTATASLSTVATLIIAVKLYDRFGLKNQIITKQAEKIFELFDLLLTQTIIAETTSGKWMIRANTDQLKTFISEMTFKQDHHKKILMSIENYEGFHAKINPIRQSYWLPLEIHDALDFFNIGMITEIEFDSQHHAKLHFVNSEKVGEYKLGLPEQTLGNFIENIIRLLDQIDIWLKKHSQIDIPLIPRY
jgi:hypothetical protein